MILHLPIIAFNSIKVRLKLVRGNDFTMRIPAFNSIKVRLKLSQVHEHRAFVTFQFHKGAIETLA